MNDMPDFKDAIRDTRVFVPGFTFIKVYSGSAKPFLEYCTVLGYPYFKSFTSLSGGGWCVKVTTKSQYSPTGFREEESFFGDMGVTPYNEGSHWNQHNYVIQDRRKRERRNNVN